MSDDKISMSEVEDDVLGVPDGMTHCDAIIMNADIPICARWWVVVNRMPAIDKAIARQAGVNPQLYADYIGKRVEIPRTRVKVNMASRFGDVGIDTPPKGTGYRWRVYMDELDNFSENP